MTHLQPLMQKWSELEPIRCWLEEPTHWIYHVSLGETAFRFNAQTPIIEQMRLLEFAVRDAAAAKGQGVMLRKNSDKEPWCCTVGMSYDSDPEAAIALLKAYLRVRWEEEEAIA